MLNEQLLPIFKKMMNILGCELVEKISPFVKDIDFYISSFVLKVSHFIPIHGVLIKNSSDCEVW